jgi:ABC-type polysaccharide/polyol phosphate export permease
MPLNAASPISVFSRSLAFAALARQRFSLAVYLARMEFFRRFSSTAGGAFWMFAGPLLSIFTIWIALDMGLSASGRFGSEFGVSFAIGLTAWLFFADVVQTATSSIAANPHLVKKVVFPVWLLPLSTAMASFAVHGVVLLLIIVVVWSTGTKPSMSIVMLPLWMAALSTFAVAVGLALASLNVRFRDTSVIAPNIVSLLFWLTPIVWPMKEIVEPMKSIILLNPMAVIIEGYRSSLGLGTGATLALSSVAVFTIIILLTVVLAMATYRRYRALFADSL